MSTRFSMDQDDVLFAVVEVWLAVGDVRELLIDSEIPANFLAESTLWVREISSPLPLPQLLEPLSRGEWCKWMGCYWENVEDEIFSQQNETVYSSLIKLSLAESRLGHIALYTFNGLPTIELATRSRSGAQLLAWSPFEPDQASRELLKMRQAIAAVLEDRSC